jgi:hypothetical protein
VLDLFAPYFEYSHYNVKETKSASKSAAGLLKGVIALEKFYKVNKEILPIKEKLSSLDH